MPRDVAELLAVLDLETIDTNLFRGIQPETALPRVFGGQAAAQAVVAAGRTVDPAYVLHSLHSYFLQPGDTSAPTIFDVETIREGRSFATRRVLGRQHGRPIYALTADFQRPEEGFEHQQRPPAVPTPEDSFDPRALRTRQPGEEEWDVMGIRFAGSSLDNPVEGDPVPGRQQVYLRVNGRLPDDPFIHVAAFTYFTDMSVMGAALAPHGHRAGSREVMIASLDHSIWFHRPFRADEWWLYDQESPFAGGGRGLVNARVHTTDGTLVASVSQEALLRKAR